MTSERWPVQHTLKIHPTHYWRVKDGTKTFEIRVNDRFFQKGDSVVLYYFDPNIPNHKIESAPDLHFEIGDVYPIDSERVVFSLLQIQGDVSEKD